MTPADEHDRFSRRLDDEWMRARLRATQAASAPSEEALLRAIGRADPLGPPAPAGWWAGVRVALAPWPVRVGVGAAVAALFLMGFALGRGAGGRDSSTLVHIAPPVPAYTPAAGRGLGAAASVDPRADDTFHAAMAFHAAPDFAVKALPLLREAVAFDASHDAAQFWLGVALLQADRPQDAVAPLEHAVRLAPADGVYKQYLVFAYLRTGAVKQAATLLIDLMRAPRR